MQSPTSGPDMATLPQSAASSGEQVKDPPLLRLELYETSERLEDLSKPVADHKLNKVCVLAAFGI